MSVAADNVVRRGDPPLIEHGWTIAGIDAK
jgi:hypothetical protein